LFFSVPSVISVAEFPVLVPVIHYRTLLPIRVPERIILRVPRLLADGLDDDIVEFNRARGKV